MVLAAGQLLALLAAAALLWLRAAGRERERWREDAAACREGVYAPQGQLRLI